MFVLRKQHYLFAKIVTMIKKLSARSIKNRKKLF
jgi:hypothetical protein